MEPAIIRCTLCGEAVYEFADGYAVMVNHNLERLPDGRARWFSRDFNAVVHICESVADAAAAYLAEVSKQSKIEVG